MFRLYEVIADRTIEIHEAHGLYTVHELGKYQFLYSSDNIKSNILFIEDETVDEKYVKEISEKEIVATPFRYFENYFGFAKISINQETFQLNILGEKFEIKEIEEIIVYLFNKNHLILSQFVSKSSISGASVYDGKEYMYSSKYLNFANSFCKTFEEQLINFQNLPHTVIRKKFRLADYNTQVVDSKSIEWVLQNLDTIAFDQSNQSHPDAIEISKNYGLIDKIGSEENTHSFQIYENEIILESFQFLEAKISEIKRIISLKIYDSSYRINSQVTQYVDFRDLQVIPFLRLLKELEKLQIRVKRLRVRYSKVFLNAKSNVQFPRLTPKFYKFHHYRKAFDQIKLLWKLEYNLEGEIQLLNIRKLSELYELYNLNIIVDTLDKVLEGDLYKKEIYTTSTDSKISKVTYSGISNNRKISLFYEPSINNNTYDLDVVTIGNVKLLDRHCRPDFVIEANINGKKRYCILDSKYSKIDTVRNIHLTACIKKYLIDVGIKNERYQKPDYLIILHPDSKDDQKDLIYGLNHFPKIATIISKLNFTNSIEKVIRSFMENT